MVELGRETQQKFKLSVFQKLSDELDIAVDLNHDSKDKKLEMMFGGKFSRIENFVWRAKITNNFIINSSIEVKLSENAKLTVSN